MNITNFIQWFINQFITIAGFMIGKLDEITIYNNVTLLDFTITITIIGMFITIVLTIPQNLNKVSSRAERSIAKKERKKKHDSE